MAGNNGIQFLRGTSTQRASNTQISLLGQPIYETDTNRLYVGDGVTKVNALKPVNAITDYWEAVEQGFITPLIGETKTIKIGGTAYKIQCIGLNHDDLVSGGKAKTTWQLVDCYTTHKMNSTNTNAGGWRDCEMRSWLNGTVLSTITDEDNNPLSSRIKQAIKRAAKDASQSGVKVVATNDYLFLPSAVEVFGATKMTYTLPSGEHARNGEGNQYEFYSEAPIPEPTTGTGQFTPLKEHSSKGTFYTSDTSVASGWVGRFGNNMTSSLNYLYNYYGTKSEEGKTTPTNWWLRSANSSVTGYFCEASYLGFMSFDRGDTAYGVSFCFCV